MNKDFITLTIDKQKNIALIAHDSKKKEIIEWCEENKEILKHHFFYSLYIQYKQYIFDAILVE